MTEENARAIAHRLNEPFPASDIEWRISRSGVTAKGHPWATCLAYVTNRAIMQRLDEVFGPVGWQNEYRHQDFGNIAPSDNHPPYAVMCGISAKVDGEWVTKWDGSEPSDFEPVKGGLSGAMKRAGAQWGIGRYLYNLTENFANIHPEGKHKAKIENEWVRWDPPALPDWALPGGQPAPVVAPEPARQPDPEHQEAQQPVRTVQPVAWDGQGEPPIPDWRNVVIPFGKQKGIPLGSLPVKSLAWWCENYQPKPYKGKISDTDARFRAALDAAQAEGPEGNVNDMAEDARAPIDDEDVLF